MTLKTLLSLRSPKGVEAGPRRWHRPVVQRTLWECVEQEARG